jgi:trans-aconitate methyltransferase
MVVLDAEHDRFEWVAASDAPVRCLPDLTRRPLEAVIEQLPRPAALEGGSFYDDGDVFSAYMQHRAWSANPNDTIEEPVFLEVLGNVRGLRILDLGCGDARFGRFLLGAGARSYPGIDASTNMVARAESILPGCVLQTSIEEFVVPPGSVDLVISRLALHYVDDVGTVLPRIGTALAPGGRLIFSVEHPIITSSDQAWRGRGRRQTWVVDDYFVTGRRQTDWLGSRVVKFHRTLEDYVRLIQTAGFRLETLREPRPSAERFPAEDEFIRRLRIPLFLLLSAVREAVS